MTYILDLVVHMLASGLQWNEVAIDDGGEIQHVFGLVAHQLGEGLVALAHKVLLLELEALDGDPATNVRLQQHDARRVLLDQQERVDVSSELLQQRELARREHLAAGVLFGDRRNVGRHARHRAIAQVHGLLQVLDDAKNRIANLHTHTQPHSRQTYTHMHTQGRSVPFHSIPFEAGECELDEAGVIRFETRVMMRHRTEGEAPNEPSAVDEGARVFRLGGGRRGTEPSEVDNGLAAAGIVTTAVGPCGGSGVTGGGRVGANPPRVNDATTGGATPWTVGRRAGVDTEWWACESSTWLPVVPALSSEPCITCDGVSRSDERRGAGRRPRGAACTVSTPEVGGWPGAPPSVTSATRSMSSVVNEPRRSRSAMLSSRDECIVQLGGCPASYLSLLHPLNLAHAHTNATISQRGGCGRWLDDLPIDAIELYRHSARLPLPPSLLASRISLLARTSNEARGACSQVTTRQQRDSNETATRARESVSVSELQRIGGREKP